MTVSSAAIAVKVLEALNERRQVLLHQGRCQSIHHRHHLGLMHVALNERQRDGDGCLLDVLLALESRAVS